jgi:hypothetical protein
MQSIAESLLCLTHLDATRCGFADADALTCLSRLPLLQRLDLAECRGLNDATLAAIAGITSLRFVSAQTQAGGSVVTQWTADGPRGAWMEGWTNKCVRSGSSGI